MYGHLEKKTQKERQDYDQRRKYTLEKFSLSRDSAHVSGSRETLPKGLCLSAAVAWVSRFRLVVPYSGLSALSVDLASVRATIVVLRPQTTWRVCNSPPLHPSCLPSPFLHVRLSLVYEMHAVERRNSEAALIFSRQTVFLFC